MGKPRAYTIRIATTTTFDSNTTILAITNVSTQIYDDLLVCKTKLSYLTQINAIHFPDCFAFQELFK